MDDSERSYGYSRDIYHGKRGAPDGEGRAGETFEESYEYGAEGGIAGEVEELSPEEQALHIVGPDQAPPDPAPDRDSYDYPRSAVGEVDSFTWDLEPDDKAEPAEPVLAGGEARRERPKDAGE